MNYREWSKIQVDNPFNPEDYQIVDRAGDFEMYVWVKPAPTLFGVYHTKTQEWLLIPQRILHEGIEYELENFLGFNKYDINDLENLEDEDGFITLRYVGFKPEVYNYCIYDIGDPWYSPKVCGLRIPEGQEFCSDHQTLDEEESEY